MVRHRRILLHIAEAAMAKLFLLAFPLAKTGVSNEHAKALLASESPISKRKPRADADMSRSRLETTIPWESSDR
jgi:hypothetical protein